MSVLFQCLEFEMIERSNLYIVLTFNIGLIYYVKYELHLFSPYSSYKIYVIIPMNDISQLL
jgi:hypothetical protein